MPLRQDDFVDLVLARRLSAVGQSGVPIGAGFSFDLAAGLDEDIAGGAARAGAIPPVSQPSAFGDFVHHLTGSGGNVPVGDLIKYADNLRRLGYLPSDFELKGPDDAQFRGAARKHADDISTQIRQGKGNPLSVSGGKAIAMLNATMPSSIWKTMGGMFTGLGKSMLDSVQRYTSPTYAHEHGGYLKHVPGDLINLLTIASIAFAAPEVGAELQSLAGGLAAGGEVLGETALRMGIKEGTGMFAKEAGEQLLARAPSWSNRIISRMAGWSEGLTGDGFGAATRNAMLEHGFRAQATRPALRMAAGIYGGLSKAAFVPQAAAILNIDSPLTREIGHWDEKQGDFKYKRKAPGAVAIADWPITLMALPEKGLIPRPLRFLGSRNFGIADPFHSYVRRFGEPIDETFRKSVTVQAFKEHNAYQRLFGKDDWGKIQREGWNVVKDEYLSVLPKEDALFKADPQAYVDRAAEWAMTPEARGKIKERLRRITHGQQTRQRLGLNPYNPLAHNREAEHLMTDINRELLLQKEPYEAAVKRAAELDKQMKKLIKTPGVNLMDEGQKISAELTQAQQEANSLQYSSALQNIAGEKKNLGIEVGSRLVPMRAEADGTILGSVDDYRKALKLWKDPATREEARGIIERLGGSTTPDDQMVKHLKLGMKHAPLDITERLPEHYQEALRDLGYRAVVGHEGMLMASDIDPLAIALPQYSKAAYWWAHTGLSPEPGDPRAIMSQTRAVIADNWDNIANEIMPDKFPVGSGRSLMLNVLSHVNALESDLAKAYPGKGFFGKTVSRAQMAMYRGFPNWPVLQDFLTKYYKIPAGEAKPLAKALYAGAREAFSAPDYMKNATQGFDTLHRLASSLTTHGWPGITETLRSMTVTDLARSKMLPFILAGAGAKEAHDRGFNPVYGAAAGLGAGALAHYGGKKLLPDHWGFLPDHLMNGALKLRFTLNPMFEARYLTKGLVISGMAEDLAPALQPLKTMVDKGIYDEASNIAARIEGWNPGTTDDLDRAFASAGIFGYNVTNHMLYDYYRVYHREYQQALAKFKNMPEQEVIRATKLDLAAHQMGFDKTQKEIETVWAANKEHEKIRDAINVRLDGIQKEVDELPHWHPVWGTKKVTIDTMHPKTDALGFEILDAPPWVKPGQHMAGPIHPEWKKIVSDPASYTKEDIVWNSYPLKQAEAAGWTPTPIGKVEHGVSDAAFGDVAGEGTSLNDTTDMWGGQVHTDATGNKTVLLPELHQPVQGPKQFIGVPNQTWKQEIEVNTRKDWPSADEMAKITKEQLGPEGFRSIRYYASSEPPEVAAGQARWGEALDDWGHRADSNPGFKEEIQRLLDKAKVPDKVIVWRGGPIRGAYWNGSLERKQAEIFPLDVLSKPGSHAGITPTTLEDVGKGARPYLVDRKDIVAFGNVHEMEVVVRGPEMGSRLVRVLPEVPEGMGPISDGLTKVDYTKDTQLVRYIDLEGMPRGYRQPPDAEKTPGWGWEHVKTLRKAVEGDPRIANLADVDLLSAAREEGLIRVRTGTYKKGPKAGKVFINLDGYDPSPQQIDGINHWLTHAAHHGVPPIEGGSTLLPPDTEVFTSFQTRGKNVSFVSDTPIVRQSTIKSFWKDHDQLAYGKWEEQATVTPPVKPVDVGAKYDEGKELIEGEKRIAQRSHYESLLKTGDLEETMKGYETAITEKKALLEKLQTETQTPEELADQSAITYLRANGRKLWSYGARSPLEKSINFVFFPFSFEKKLLTLAKNWFTAQPVRTMIVHEAYKRVQMLENSDPKHKDRLSAVLNKYAPIFRQVQKLNAFGEFSPGEFFGLNPLGAVYKPLADALKVPVDVVQGAFSPVGISGPENAKKLNSIKGRLIPGLNAVNSIVGDVSEQFAIATRKQPETADAQVEDYFTTLHAIQQRYAAQGTDFGTDGEIDSFSRSKAVPDDLKVDYQHELSDLRQKYPIGATVQANGAAKPAQQELEVERILRKTNKTRAEQAIVSIVATEVDAENDPAFYNSGDDPTVRAMKNQSVTELVRQRASQLLRIPGFNDLWEALGFSYVYGPIELETP